MSEFSKPKVTIDLEEYNQLISKKESKEEKEIDNGRFRLESALKEFVEIIRSHHQVTTPGIHLVVEHLFMSLKRKGVITSFTSDGKLELKYIEE